MPVADQRDGSDVANQFLEQGKRPGADVILQRYDQIGGFARLHV